jgi:glycine cleavage system transcriptional repressor
MQRKIVLTLSGPDRVGLVDEVTERLLALGGNVEVSRMIRLGGAFAILLLVSLPANRLADLDAAVAALGARGYHAATTPAEGEKAGGGGGAGWPAWRIEVTGADHEGIIHEIAHAVARFGINIESLETGVERAPISGAALFRMTALVAAPPELAGRDWAGELAAAGRRLNVEISVSAT